MFQAPSFSMEGSFGGGGLESIIGLGRSLIDMQMQKKAARQAAKGGPSYALGYSGGGGGGMQLPSWLGGTDFPQSPVGRMLGFAGEQSASFAGCFRTVDPTRPRVTPCRVVSAVGPNGQVYEWVYRGRPVLYSGDLSTARRVNKLLGRGRGRTVRARSKSRCR